jgi:hypothetical protein
MGDVIELRTRRPPTVPKGCGMIDLYPVPNGKVGVDACVPLSVALTMVTAVTEHSSEGWSLTGDLERGMAMLDVHWSEHVVARALIPAREAGIPIRRSDT